MNFAEVQTEVNNAAQTQRYKKRFDLTITFTAAANTADSVTIPLITEGAFIQESVNIRYTSNSSYTNDPDGTPDFHGSQNFVGLRFRSQAAGNAQSSDYVPVQLIATPGAEGSPRYGARPCPYYYPKGDAIIIEYNNKEPEKLNGEAYDVKNERIEVCISGYIYPNIAAAEG